MISKGGSEEEFINARIINYMHRVYCGEKPVKSGKLSLMHDEKTLSIPIHSFEDRFEACIVSKLFLDAFGPWGISKMLLRWFDDGRTKVKLKFECGDTAVAVGVFGKEWEEQAEQDKERVYGGKFTTYPEAYMLPSFVMMCEELIKRLEKIGDGK